jgi:hypothetical protein
MSVNVKNPVSKELQLTNFSNDVSLGGWGGYEFPGFVELLAFTEVIELRR